MSSIPSRRLMKELKDLQEGKTLPPGVSVVDASNLSRWVLKIEGAKDTLYEGESFRLQFTFPASYPLESPEVIFLTPAPLHGHIYSNGHICLSILYDEWSPCLTVASVCLSILSMLSSSTSKEPPVGDASYSMRMAGRSPKSTSWVFHDDKA